MMRYTPTLIATLAAIATTACTITSPALEPTTTPASSTAQISVPEIPPPPEGLTPPVSEILDASPDADWRPLDPERTLYMDFPKGRVIIELAPDFAPNHAANVQALSREGYFAGGAVTRVQDNFVAQWAQAATPARPPKKGVETLKAEFTRSMAADLEFTVLPDPDTFAPEVGFTNGFPAARDGDEIWLAHCYGAVGVGRDEDPDSGGGTELYAIISQSPRHLDRNLTVLGRVVQGMDILASLPRGTGEMSFYENQDQYVRFADMKLASETPSGSRTPLEVLRTDSPTFAALVNNRRWRKDTFYRRPAGRIGVCNIQAPVRPSK